MGDKILSRMIGNARFGKWLMAKRKEAGFSRKDAAVDTWLSHKDWAQVEQGKAIPGSGPLEMMARNLGIEPAVMFRQAGHIVSMDVDKACAADPDICTAIRVLVYNRDTYDPARMKSAIETEIFLATVEVHDNGT